MLPHPGSLAYPTLTVGTQRNEESEGGGHVRPCLGMGDRPGGGQRQMTHPEARPPPGDDARTSGNAGVSEQELREWAGSCIIYLRIAAALATQITEKNWPSWHPVPENSELAQVWDCSPDTAARAKRLLSAHGVLVYENRAYYVA